MSLVDDGGFGVVTDLDTHIRAASNTEATPKQTELPPAVAMEAKHWDGKGVPPVGTICEAYHEPHKRWYKVQILYHQVSGFGSKVACYEDDDELLFWAWDVRPCNPERVALIKSVAAIIAIYTPIEAATKLIDEGYINLP